MSSQAAPSATPTPPTSPAPPVTSTPPAPPTPPESVAPTETRYRLRWAGLAVILVAEVMDLLDTTIVQVASPAIQRAFGGSDTQIQWIAAAYTLAFAVLLVTGARLGDLYGRKRLFVLGAAGFTLASTLCAVATGPGLLIGARIAQGAFGALLIPQGLGLIKAMFPPRETGAAFALFGPVLGLSSVLGPTLGGYLTSADLFGTGWRMIFLINLPLGLIAVLAAVRILPADTRTRGAGATRLDPVGVLLLSAAVLLAVYPLVQGRELGWPLWTYLAMAAALPVLWLFLRHQRWAERTGRSPLVEPSLLAKRPFTSALATGLVFFGALSGLMLALTLYFQLGLGWTPLHAGLTMIPLSLGMVAGAILSGAKLAPRYGRRVLHAGLAVAALGILGVRACTTHWPVDLTSWELVPAVLLTGFGLGLIMAPFFDIALAGVDDHEVGSASGVLNAVQQLGGSVGVAVFGTVLFDHAAGHGFQPAAALTLALVAAALAVAFLVAFLLPHHPRPEGEH
ncbi:MFS transporter [Kitasatospora sp. NPDC057015]|uniref:MFS transporter n=1 Tax=Kitasatospora sp. NPDC057015 TaxID=3346001 RepID=UPI00363F7CD7